MDEDEILEFLEAENAALLRERKRRRLQLRQKSDPFNLDEEEFIKRYRLTKDLTYKLCEELRPFFKSPRRSTDLSVETKVLIALSFYASGSYQRPIGTSEGHFVAQQTVSLAISQVTACLNALEMRQKYIKFPATDEERNRVKTRFFKKFHIPDVLGCIDCSQIAIVRPVQHEKLYLSQKNYHSLNVQFICDADMQIMSVDPSHGGSTPNSLIWSNHPLKSQLEDLTVTQNSWFLGDSGYTLSKSIMTPILDAPPNTPEEHYNNLHVRARNIIERTIGLLKTRFRCLLAHTLHYPPEAAGSIVTACVILHNICNEANVPIEHVSHVLRAEPPRSSNIDVQLGLATQKALVQKLWETRTLES